MSEKVKLKITTLTPVTIGSGAELSPYFDYIIEKNQVCFIDKKNMQDKILQKGDQFFDLYVEGVASKMDNNRSEFDIKSFLTNNQIVNNIEEVISYSCPLNGKADSKLPIKGLLKTPFQEPYFPGSSIKGALKTVLMYNWLKNEPNANSKIEEVIKGKDDNTGSYKDVSFDWLEKKFECFVNEPNGLIRPNTLRQVTDSTCLTKNSVLVVDCYRNIPIRFECIAKNVKAEFELTLENYEWQKLAIHANDYAFYALGRELQILEQQGKNGSAYYSKIDKLQVIINDCPKESNTAYLRLGFGKGYYLNSLGIAIYDYLHDEDGNILYIDLYKKFESFLKKQFPKSNQKGNLSFEEFPNTRLYTTKSHEPLGWVKIEKI